MIYTLLLMVLLVNKSSPIQEAASKPVVHSVCDIVEHPSIYDHKVVTIESLLVASGHGVVLAGEACHKGIYVSHEAGRTDGNWPAFDRALVKKQTGLEMAPLRVRVSGIFRDRVPYGKTTIRQIELNRVLDVAFQAKLSSR